MNDTIAELVFKLSQELKKVTKHEMHTCTSLDMLHDDCLSLLTENDYCMDCGGEGHQFENDPRGTSPCRQEV